MEQEENQNGIGGRGIAAIVGAIVILIAGYFGIDLGGSADSDGPSSVSAPTVIVDEGSVDQGGFEIEPVDDGTVIDSGGEAESPVDDAPVVEASEPSNVDEFGWYEIFFTDPSCPPAEERIGGMDEIVAEDIVNAAFQVDIAAFDLDSEPMIEALISAEEAGNIVRVVVDDEHTPAEVINRLRRNGVSVVEDQRSALMHNKFVIIDQEVLWTGSTNFSSNGIFCNNNNMVRIHSLDLAANYGIEMDEMYDDRSFGARSPVNTARNVEVNGVRIENHFSPESEVAPVVAREIARADSEILFLAFSFTNDDVGEAVLERAEAGLDIRGVFEKVGSDTTFSYYPDFRRAKLDNLQVRTDGNGRIMHHKVFIIDRQIVAFGSFNYTNSGNDNNDENTLIIHDPEFASYFIEEFELVWAEAEEE